MKPILLALMLFAAVPATAQDVRNIHAAPTKATPAQVEALAAGGFMLTRGIDQSQLYQVFTRDGLADFSVSLSSVRCEKPARYRVRGTTIRFECLAVKHSEKHSIASSDRRTFELEMRLLAPDVIVLVEDLPWFQVPLSPREAVWLYQDHPTRPEPGTTREYAESSTRYRAQVLPGSRERALFNTVMLSLRKDESDKLSSALSGVELFQGAPAREPRVESEIYYANSGREIADEIAAALAPIIGPVTPKEWPGGKWDYDVVVVVGSKVAGARAEPATTP